MKAGELLGDRYKLERVLGQGGMGVVWAARDMHENRRVAIKLIIDDTKADSRAEHLRIMEELKGRLQREATACMRLEHHPNVVRVLDWSMEETTRHGPFMVMELLEGQSLLDYLKRKRLIEPKVAARIMGDVASCLAAAHSFKLIHRDLKPGNIFLHHPPGHDDEDDFVTKVLDFGVCKDGEAVDVGAPDAVAKTTGVLGSVAYMSPQQAANSGKVDAKADIWSVGVVLYEMVTGLRAFSGLVQEVYVQHFGPILAGKRAVPVPPPSTQVRGIPSEIDEIVLRCTKPKPEDRYASAEELARDLYAFAGAPMPAISPAKPSRSQTAPSPVRELIDIYEPAILESKAVPAANEAHRFNQFAQTIPLKRVAEVMRDVPAPVIEDAVPTTKQSPTFGAAIVGAQSNAPMDLSELDATVRMAPKSVPGLLSRPPVLSERSDDAALRTQIMREEDPKPTPAPNWGEIDKYLDEEKRKSSLAIPIPDLPDALDGAGQTQALPVEAFMPAPVRVDSSATTSVASSQAIPVSSPSSSDASVSARRRRGGRRVSYVVGGLVTVLLGLLPVVVVLKRSKAPEPPREETTQAPKDPVATIPKPLVTVAPAPEVTATPPASAVEKVESVPAAAVSVEAPKPAPEPTVAVTAAPPKAPTPTVTTKPTAAAKTGPAGQKCTGVGIFKRCK